MGGEASGPEVDGGGGQGGVRGEVGGEEVVGAPPEEEAGAEDESGGEAMVEAREAVGAEDPLRAVDGAAVEALVLVGRVLDLQARFYVLDGGGDEGDGEAGHDAGNGVAEGGEFAGGVLGSSFCGSKGGGAGFAEALWCEDILLQKSTVVGQ